MKINNSVRIGVIADDFTGASDAASFLIKSGAKTVLFTKIPDVYNEPCDAIVIALKSRSVEPKEAIRQSREAIDFLNKLGVDCVYFKYCSTFDSTPIGNIGVVLDFILDYLQVPYTLLCPSLPVNGRTVKDGDIHVFGVPLHESMMKDHPLNPMWDSYIPSLMKKQSQYPCFVINRRDMEKQKLATLVSNLKEKHERFYLIPDYECDKDGLRIANMFATLPVLSGGSGLLEHLLTIDRKEIETQYTKPHKAILLCGSCSTMSKKQIQHFHAHGGAIYPVDSKKLLNKSLSADEIFKHIKESLHPVLVYSDAVEKNILQFSNTDSFTLEANLIETLMADLSVMARDDGFDCIIVAGGETSGAVSLRLGYESYHIGHVIAPGVPTMIPLQNNHLRLILKSGNFGNEDFFNKALGKETKYANGL